MSTGVNGLFLFLFFIHLFKRALIANLDVSSILLRELKELSIQGSLVITFTCVVIVVFCGNKYLLLLLICTDLFILRILFLLLHISSLCAVTGHLV